MPTIFDARERGALQRRIAALTPDRTPAWGRMTAHQAVCHLTDALESSYSTEPVPPATGPLTRFPLKWLVINVLPWPKGKMQSPPELLRRQPGAWDADVAELREMLERVGTRDPGGAWPDTPAFGPLGGRGWGALLRKHIDHHLRQFGV